MAIKPIFERMENKVASLIWAFTPSMIKSSQIQKAQIQIHFQIQYHFHFIFHHPRTVRNTTLYKTSSSTSTTFTTSYKLTSSVTLSLSLSLMARNPSKHGRDQALVLSPLFTPQPYIFLSLFVSLEEN